MDGRGIDDGCDDDEEYTGFSFARTLTAADCARVHCCICTCYVHRLEYKNT